jgi:hypothetical protein
MLREASLAENGRIEEPYHAYLTIDTGKPAVWIEYNGQVLPDNYTELPHSMTWRVYRCAPEANSELGPVVRLKIRGVHRPTAEEFYVVGTGRRIGQMHVNFNVQTCGSGYSSGPFRLRPFGRRRPDTSEHTHGSIVVSDEQYQQYQNWLAASGAPEGFGTDAAEESPLAANRAKWLKVEKLLYQMIEAEVRYDGLDLESLEFGVGPDYTAAHAELVAGDHSVLGGILGRQRSGDAYLRIDSLGNGIWYAKTGPYPGQTPARLGTLELEFLVGTGGEIPKAQYNNWIMRGRQKQQGIMVPASEWRATLPNGVTVEFVGLCDHPSAGKQWWGADGSQLGYAPYWNVERHAPKGADGNVFEMAWREYWPPSRNPGACGSVRCRIEDALGERGLPTRDRYGARIHNLTARSCAFEKGQKQVTVRVGFATFVEGQFEDGRVPDEQFQWVRFKNISLVRGENRGAEIEMEN